MRKKVLIPIVFCVLCIACLCSSCSEKTWNWGVKTDPSGKRTTTPGETSILAEDGCYTWWTDMLAVRYVGKKDQTYVSYVDEYGALSIAAYNHETGEVVRGEVAKFKLIDDHNSAGLAVLPNGKILAVYNKHNADKKIRWKVSKNAEDVTSFGKEQYVECENKVTYAQLHRISYEEYRIFYRAMNGWGTRVYNWVDDEWSEEVTWLKETKGGQFYLYTQEDAETGKINVFMTGHPKSGYDQNIRYGYFTTDGDICNMDGTVIGNLNKQAKEILTPREFVDVVYEAGSDDHTRLYDIAYMGEKLGVMYGVGIGSEDTSKYYYAYYDAESGKWVNNFICDSGKWLVEGNMYFGGVSYDKKDMQTIYVSRREGGLNRLEKWKTTDYGATWQTVAVIDEGTRDSHVNMRPIVPYNAHDDIDVIYIKGLYPAYSKFNTDLMIYAD